jgi:hypothetical protein
VTVHVFAGSVAGTRLWPHSTQNRIAVALLIEAREKAGLTQEAFAARFGQSEAFISSYEEGARLLDPSEYIALAWVVEVDPYELPKQAEATSLQSGAGVGVAGGGARYVYWWASSRAGDGGGGVSVRWARQGGSWRLLVRAEGAWGRGKASSHPLRHRFRFYALAFGRRPGFAVAALRAWPSPMLFARSERFAA